MLGNMPKDQILARFQELSVSKEEILLTCIIIQILELKMSEEKEIWELIVTKAKKCLKKLKLDKDTMEHMVQLAKELVLLQQE